MIGKVEAAKKTDPLLLLGHIEEDLDQSEAVVGEIPLPGVDLSVTAPPDAVVAERGRELLALEQLGMDPDYQNLLVVGPVEDANLSRAGRRSAYLHK